MHFGVKLELTILNNDIGIFCVIEKCLCVMFGFQFRIVHISKDDAFNNDNNITRFIYQVLLPSAHRLGWTLHVDRFRTIGENLPKSF
jgi:hypothetical protein